MKDSLASIFNIQKFSIHDGPGIRTVVFFKGCPLSCKWCSNPESQSLQPELLWDRKKCTLCQSCIHACPNQALSLKQDRIHSKQSQCDTCLNCIKQCTNKALEIKGEWKDIKSIIDEVMKDYEFYEESGGGVTLSGGEVMVQHQTAKKLLLQLKELGVHTACETTGYANHSIFADFISPVDLLLYDIKHYDSNMHLKYTGVPNDSILKNLHYAINQKKEIIIRIPVIPSFNDSLQDAECFCNLLQKIGIQRIDLLPFHQFGEKKYEMTAKEYSMSNMKQLSKDDLADYHNVFLQAGLDCRF